MKLSIGRALDDMRSAFKRDGHLYVAVFLAFAVVPSLLFGLAMPRPQAEPNVAMTLLTLAVVTLGFFSHLTIQRLVLSKGMSVGQALRGSLLPTLYVFLAVLLVILPLALVMSPFVPAMQSGNPAAAGPAASAVLLILLLALIPLSRLILAFPIAAVRGAGPLSMIGGSWKLTRGNTLKLFGLALLFLFLLVLMIQLATWSVGSVSQLLLGPPEPWSLSALIVTLAIRLAQMVVVLPFVVLAACLYAQATAGEAAQEVSVPRAGDHEHGPDDESGRNL